MNDKLSFPAFLPQEHFFDFKVKVNYQNGAVSLIGPNQYSPAHHPIRFNQTHHNPNTPPHQSYHFHNQPHIFPNEPTSMRSIPFAENNFPQKNYSSATFIPVPRKEQKDEYEDRGEGVLCVICEKQFTSRQFEAHLQFHRHRNKNKNVAPENQKASSFQQNPYIQIKNNSLSSRSSQSNMKISHNPEQLYSFQKIGDSLQLQQQIKRQEHFPYSLNSSNSFSSHSSPYYQEPQIHNERERISMPEQQKAHANIIRFSEPLVNGIGGSSHHNTSHRSSFSGHSKEEKVNQQRSFGQSDKNSSNLVQVNSSSNLNSSYFSQQYLKGIIEKAKLRETNRKRADNFGDYESDRAESQNYYDHQSKVDFYQSVTVRNMQSSHQFSSKGPFQAEVREKSPSKGSLFYKKQIKNSGQMQEGKNTAISHRDRLKKMIHEYDSSQDEEPNRSGISSIQEIKEPLQNLSREEMILISQVSKKNFPQVNEQVQRPIKPSQRNISLSRNTNSERNLNSFHSASFASSSNIGQEKPMSVENIGVHSRQVFRGVQVEQSEILNQADNMNSSCQTKSSKTSTKSKLPINYFAINDVLERSRKE